MDFAPLDKEIWPLRLGSLYLSVLAYPVKTRKRERFRAALICEAAAEMKRDPARYGEPPDALHIVSSVRDISAMERAIKDGCRIISGQRFIAAKMALGEYAAFLADKIGEQRPTVVPSHSSNKMLEAISIERDDARRRDSRGRKSRGGASELSTGNIISRIWTPSLPVLHLAIPLYVSFPKDMSVGDVLFDLDLCTRLMEQSKIQAPTLAMKFEIDAATQPFIVLKSEK